PKMVGKYGVQDEKSGVIFDYVIRSAPIAMTAAVDPRGGEQWAWDKIEAPRAWARASQVVTGPLANPVKVGIVDSGVMRTHEDLPGAHITCYSVLPGGSNEDAKGH